MQRSYVYAKTFFFLFFFLENMATTMSKLANRNIAHSISNLVLMCPRISCQMAEQRRDMVTFNYW